MLAYPGCPGKEAVKRVFVCFSSVTCSKEEAYMMCWMLYLSLSQQWESTEGYWMYCIFFSTVSFFISKY